MTITAESPLASLAAVPDMHVPLVLTAAEPIMHAAGSSGNTQCWRTQDILLDDGQRASVPYVSGNSLRHSLRAALAWHLIRLLEVPCDSVPKQVTDLLWSGGSLSAAGSSTDLGLARRAQAAVPGLGLLGYSARSDIHAGTLSVDNVHAVCAENRFRLPPHLEGHPHAVLPAGAMLGEEFGTRHDITGTPAGRYIALAAGDAPPTAQMIYDAQVIKPGTVLFTALWLSAPAAGHVAALATALDEAAPLAGGGRRRIILGGRRSSGYGTCLLDDGALGGPAAVTELRRSYEDHLRSRRDEVLALLAEVTG